LNNSANHNEPDVEFLAQQWLKHKAAEAAARDARVQVERDMLPFLEQKTEGARTTTTDKGTKITVKRALNRKLSQVEWRRIKGKIPPDLHPVKMVEMLDNDRVKYLINNEPDTWQELSVAITTTEQKPNITVKEANDGV